MKADVRENLDLCGKIQVYLNGEEISNRCIAFDDEAGTAEVYAMNGTEFVEVRGEFKTETLRGKITYTIKQ